MAKKVAALPIGDTMMLIPEDASGGLYDPSLLMEDGALGFMEPSQVFDVDDASASSAGMPRHVAYQDSALAASSSRPPCPDLGLPAAVSPPLLSFPPLPAVTPAAGAVDFDEEAAMDKEAAVLLEETMALLGDETAEPAFEEGATVRALPWTNGGGNTGRLFGEGAAVVTVVGALSVRPVGRGGRVSMPCYPISRPEYKGVTYWPADRLIETCASGSDRFAITRTSHRTKEQVHDRKRATDAEAAEEGGALDAVTAAFCEHVEGEVAELRAEVKELRGAVRALAARDAGVRRMTYASSSSIYGEARDRLAKSEDMLPAPLSPYGVSKLAAEQYCMAFHSVYGFEVVALRYFNVFGPRQDPKSEYAAVIPRFINALLRGKAPIIYGDGEQTRDFTFVGNIVSANLHALEHPSAPGQIFNIAMGDMNSLNYLVATLQKLIGVDIPPCYAEPRPGDIRHSFADVSRAANILQFAPQISLVDGLRTTVQWYRTRSVLVDTK